MTLTLPVRVLITTAAAALGYAIVAAFFTFYLDTAYGLALFVATSTAAVWLDEPRRHAQMRAGREEVWRRRESEAFGD